VSTLILFTLHRGQSRKGEGVEAWSKTEGRERKRKERWRRGRRSKRGAWLEWRAAAPLMPKYGRSRSFPSLPCSSVSTQHHTMHLVCSEGVCHPLPWACLSQNAAGEDCSTTRYTHFKLALCVILLDVTNQIRHISEIIPLQIFPRNELVDVYSLVTFWIFANFGNKLIDIYGLVWWEQSCDNIPHLVCVIIHGIYVIFLSVWLGDTRPVLTHTIIVHNF
jgi:hypothetical protein